MRSRTSQISVGTPRINFWLVLPFFFLGLSNAIAQTVTSETSTLEGQFVCSQCWFEADRETVAYGTAADLECAKECAERKVPPAIAVNNQGKYKLFLIEEGRFKKPGEDWLEYIGKQVRVSGPLRSVGAKRFIALDELKVIGENPISARQSAAIGTEAELVLKDLFGIEQKLSAYRGKVVILNFWATWCIPCRKEMPDLTAIQNEYAAFGVQVVGASADPMTDRKKVISFIRDTRINFPIWLGATTEDLKRFGLGPGLPATAIIGRDGKVVWLKNTVITLADLRKQLDGLLAANSQSIEREIAASRNNPAEASLVPS